MSTLRIEPSSEPTSRSNLIAAFKRVIKRAGRPRATDLHVRRLLLYVQAKDHNGTGLERSLQQLSDKLFLTVSSCRRVIRRAVKHFGLLIVISQRHTPGGQTVNRYAINWEHVEALLCDKDRENAHLEEARQVAKDLSILAEGRKPSGSSHLSSKCASGSDGSDRLAPDSHSESPVLYDQPPPPRLHSAFARLAHTRISQLSLASLRLNHRTSSNSISRASTSRRSASHRMLSPIMRLTYYPNASGATTSDQPPATTNHPPLRPSSLSAVNRFRLPIVQIPKSKVPHRNRRSSCRHQSGCPLR